MSAQSDSPFATWMVLLLLGPHSVVQLSILFCLLLPQNYTLFPTLTVIYESWDTRTSYLRSLIHPGCGCFMVVYMGRPQHNAKGLLVLFIPVNQSRILQDFSPLFLATFQSQYLMVCKNYYTPAQRS